MGDVTTIAQFGDAACDCDSEQCEWSLADEDIQFEAITSAGSRFWTNSVSAGQV